MAQVTRFEKNNGNSNLDLFTCLLTIDGEISRFVSLFDDLFVALWALVIDREASGDEFGVDVSLSSTRPKSSDWRNRK